MAVNRKTIFILVLIVPFLIFSFARADIQGQSQIFNVNDVFDKFNRKSITATLRHIGDNSYFYIEDDYWNTLDAQEKDAVSSNIRQLSLDFDSNIYPKETSFWGSESKPGIDGDGHIVILIEQLKSTNGGYFSTSNGYPKSIAPDSNEKEMIAVSAESLKGSYAKTFLAHEFQHLISLNQKEMMRRINEDVWLNELRSEYSATLVGYNEPFLGSNLSRRADLFFSSLQDSLTEWPNVSLDYSLVSLFGEYISEQLGEDFLRDTLHSSLSGIASFNEILSLRKVSERFVDVFANWLAASYLNDSSINSKFGYAKSELRGLRINPGRLTILSTFSSLNFGYSVKPWDVSGHKFYLGNPLIGKTIKLIPNLGSKFFYVDNFGRSGIFDKDFYVTDPSTNGGLQYFFIFPINDKKASDFKTKEEELFMSLAVSFEDKSAGTDFGSGLKEGLLIKKPNETEIYVITGKYKRYLRPEIISLYGHLNANLAVEVSNSVFNSYPTSNYVKYVNEEQVYAIWPDGTKHWLNITPRQWDESGRDWNAIFVINDLELNTYRSGANITR